MPLGTKKSNIDAVIAIKDVYPKLLSYMKDLDTLDELANSGRIGIGWGSSGGEASAMFNERYLAADGIENCIRVLEDLEDDKFGDLDFVELDACPGGCVGGVLTVENPYIAKVKLKQLRRFFPYPVTVFPTRFPNLQNGTRLWSMSRLWNWILTWEPPWKKWRKSIGSRLTYRDWIAAPAALLPAVL